MKLQNKQNISQTKLSKMGPCFIWNLEFMAEICKVLYRTCALEF